MKDRLCLVSTLLLSAVAVMLGAASLIVQIGVLTACYTTETTSPQTMEQDAPAAPLADVDFTNVVDEMPIIATAYCACQDCCGKTDGITKTGTKATAGRTIAVDPAVIPLGSIVEIDGIKYIAEDIGGAIKGNRVDIYFDTHEEALQFGKQDVIAYVRK